MMFRAFFSLFIAVFALSLMLGGAYATFSKEYTSPAVTFQAGFVDLSLANASDWDQEWFDGHNMGPGDTVSYIVTAGNTGNVPVVIDPAGDKTFVVVAGDLSSEVSGSVASLEAGWGVPIPAGGQRELKVSLAMDPTAGNESESDTGSAALKVTVNSVAH